MVPPVLASGRRFSVVYIICQRFKLYHKPRPKRKGKRGHTRGYTPLLESSKRRFYWLICLLAQYLRNVGVEGPNPFFSTNFAGTLKAAFTQ